MAVWRVTGGDVRLHGWSVFRTTRDPVTFHVVGDDGWEGKVCSPILRVNRHAGYVETRSRKYYLVGEPASNLSSDARYVFDIWTSINNCTDTVEMYPPERAWEVLIRHMPTCNESTSDTKAPNRHKVGEN